MLSINKIDALDDYLLGINCGDKLYCQNATSITKKILAFMDSDLERSVPDLVLVVLNKRG